MRIVPCRVVCYYKFNVKSGWQKMRVVEGGGSASEMEAFIFLFCWSANVFKGKEKSKVRKADLKEEKSFHSRPHSEAYSTPWPGASCLS